MLMGRKRWSKMRTEMRLQFEWRRVGKYSPPSLHYIDIFMFSISFDKNEKNSWVNICLMLIVTLSIECLVYFDFSFVKDKL